MTRLVETFDSMIIEEAVLMEHPGHGSQKVHGRRLGGIADVTVKQGGFSANWVGHQPRSGYMVGGVVTPHRTSAAYGAYTNADGSATTKTRGELKDELKSFIQKNREALRKPGAYLGTWVDDDGHVWIDVSQRVATRGQAMRIASTRSELAIYDVKRGQSLDVPKGGPKAETRSQEQAMADLQKSMSTATPLPPGGE